MNYHTQNLNDGGSKFWHGRGWLYAKRELRLEWCFGKKANAFHFKLKFGEGDFGNGMMLVIGFPWLFDFYISLAGMRQFKKSFETGLAIHNNSFWIYPLSWTNEWNGMR